MEIISGDADYEFILPRLKDMYISQGAYAKTSEFTGMTGEFDELINPNNYMLKEPVAISDNT